MTFSFLFYGYTSVRKITNFDYIALNKNKEKVFIKVISNIHELEALDKIKHPNIISYNKKFKLNKYYAIEFPYISNKEIEYNNKKQVFIDLLDAVLYLISKKIVQCDIKPSNILINKNKIVFIDFSHYRMPYEKIKLKQDYFSVPEFEKGKTAKYSDLYGIGLIFSFMILGNDFFCTRYINNLSFRRKLLKVLKSRLGNDSLLRLIEVLLNIKSYKRKITMKKALVYINNSKILK